MMIKNNNLLFTIKTQSIDFCYVSKYTFCMKNFKDKLVNHLKSKHFWIVVGFMLVIIFWDLVTKSLTDGYEIAVIPGFIGFSSTHNTGGAWSIFSKYTWLLIIFSIIFLLAITFFDIVFDSKNKLYTAGITLIFGGAVGNLIDRLALGYVRDFINFEFFVFPTFNLADSCLVAGVICIAVFALFIYPNMQANEQGIKVWKRKQRVAKQQSMTKSNVVEDKTLIENESTKTKNNLSENKIEKKIKKPTKTKEKK